MGSSSWFEFVPYHADAVAAIRAYQRQMFDDGLYEHFEGVHYATLEDLQNDPDDENGWHSLLDIVEFYSDEQQSITNILEYRGDSYPFPRNRMGPLPRATLLQAFPEGRPTRAELTTLFHRGEPRGWRDLPRGTGLYTVVYEADQPSAIAVWGSSGD